MADAKEKALEWKAQGNAALSSKDFGEAIECYTKAIELDPTGHVFWSNRSAAKLSSGDAAGALADAEECIAANGTWVKGFGRKGAALHQLKRWEDADAAYDAGLAIKKGDKALLRGKADAARAADAAAAASAFPGDLGSMFGGGGGMNGGQVNGLLGMLGSDDNIRAKCLASGDAETRAIATDASFFSMVSAARANPSMGMMLQQDPRFLKVFSAVLSGPGGFDGMASDAGASGAAAKAEPVPEPEPEPEPEVVLTEEEQAEKDAADAAAAALAEKKAAALAIKAEGNVAFKAKDYAAAIAKYSEAIAVDGDEPTFFTNRAKAHYGLKDYATCLADCDAAIIVCRRVHSPYAYVAKVFCQKALALAAVDDLAGACRAYEDALMEDRSRPIEKKLKKMEKIMKQKAKAAYLSPEEGDLAKARGNAFVKEANWPFAIREYTDAVKRNPENPVYYSNRAMVYMKLMEWGHAMADCDKAIALATSGGEATKGVLVKAIARKAEVQFFLKDYNKALNTYKMGLELDNKSSMLVKGYNRTMQKIESEMQAGGAPDEERIRRAQQDPEVRAILGDPVMQSILKDMQTNPTAAQKHMANPDIAAKLQKLVAAGILSFGGPAGPASDPTNPRGDRRRGF